MGDIPNRILQLTDNELRKALLEIGIKPAPLTSTTRKIYQRKLLKATTQTVVKSPVKSEKEVPEPKQNTSQPEGGSNSTPPFLPQGSEGDANQACYLVKVPSQPETRLYSSRAEAREALREHKDARFQRFSSRREAEESARSGGGREQPGLENCATSRESANDLPAPKQADLNELARAIERNDLEGLERLAWGNPRYLISAADGPVPLKPNVRYNALHVAARSNRPDVVQKILSLLQDPAFHRVMYRDAPSRDRMEHIVDLYANTPERGHFETPLHLASKLGFVDVVAELLACPLTDRNARNDDNETPMEVACSRCNDKSTRHALTELFDERYYVPLMRCHDNSKPPLVHQPWTPSSGDVDGSLTSGPSGEPTDGVMVVSALAGPMSRSEAEKVHQQWTTPDRKLRSLRLADAARGGERVGRKLVEGGDVPWLEYWDFLGDYADFSKEEGLSALEDHLSSRATSAQWASRCHDDSIDELTSDSSCPVFPSPTRGRPSRGKTPKQRQLDSVRKRLLKVRREQLHRVGAYADGASPHRTSLRSASDHDNPVENLAEKFAEKLCLDGELPWWHPSVSTPNNQLSAVSGDGLRERVFDSPGCGTLFLGGNQPSRVDREVIEAMSEVDAAKFPHVACWTRAVLSYAEEDRKRWATPRRSLKSSRLHKPPPFHNVSSPLLANQSSPRKAS